MIPSLAVFLVLVLVQHASSRLTPGLQEAVVNTSGKQKGRTLAQLDRSAAASSRGSDIIPDQYIVFFQDQAGPANVAARSLVAEVTATLARRASSTASAAATADATSGTEGSDDADALSVVQVIGTPASGAKSAAATSSSTVGVQAAVLRASRRAVRHIRRSALVKAVIQDREVVTQQTIQAELDDSEASLEPQQAICVEAQYLSVGVAAAASSTFIWPRCRIAGSKLVWKGVPCGDGSKILYTELRAVRQNGALIGNCILTPDPARRAWTLQRFGSCGVRPKFTTALPTAVCSATGGNPGSGSSSPSPATSPSPSLPPVVQQPPATPGNPTLPKTPVASGEEVTPNMQRIEAATAAGVGNTAGLPASQQVTVAVIDSGIDGTHPDLNLKGGMTWATPSTTVVGDVASHDVDFYGHGTHVAGIIGAKNSGQGVLGVVPNTPLYSLKVLNGEGKGSLSNVLQAVKFTYSPEGKAAQIGVINLSLASKFDPNSATYQQDLLTVCSVFKEASDNGIVITAAAGNYATNMRGYIPASCPTVMAVTSLDVEDNAPSAFSNYLPADATAAERSTMISAPGSDIYSTLTYKKDPTGYRSLSGTSMASPHVAGVAAACIMSGACPAGSTGLSRISMIQAAAQERLSLAAGYGFPAAANGNFYGRLVWAKW